MGGGGAGGRSVGGFGGRSVSGAGGRGGCDLGCEQTTQGSNVCDNDEVLWTCRSIANLDQFNDNCNDVPTGLARYCCSEDFTPTCD